MYVCMYVCSIRLGVDGESANMLSGDESEKPEMKIPKKQAQTQTQTRGVNLRKISDRYFHRLAVGRLFGRPFVIRPCGVAGGAAPMVNKLGSPGDCAG